MIMAWVTKITIEVLSVKRLVSFLINNLLVLLFSKKVRTIETIYASYRCRICHKESILLTEEVSSTLRDGKYISCSHCGSNKLKKVNETDSIKECMKHRSYKREHGAIKQVRNE